MKPARRPLTLLHRIALLAMLLPFLALAALPAGVMPGRAEAGRLTLVLCTPDGPREMQADLAPGKAPAERPACPWAVAHAAFALPDVPKVPVPAIGLVAAEPARILAALRPAPLPLRGEARAPPLPA